MCKNILFVINTLSKAGAEVALLELLNQFPEEEWQVDLYVILGQGELVTHLPKHVRLLNPVFSEESVLSGKGRRIMFLTVLKSMFRRATVIRRLPYLMQNFFHMVVKGSFHVDKLLWRVLADGAERYDKEYDLAVAYVEGGSAYYVADYVKAKKKAAFIHVDFRMAGYGRLLDGDCYARFDKIFPISEETEKSLLELYPELKGKTFVFHNIINQKVIREKALLPGGFTDDYHGLRILTVGRLNKQKAYPVAIEALKLLREEGLDARWYVLGEGEERKALEQKIRDLSLEGEFLLPGAVENPYPYFKQTDLYVHATAYEGKSIAIQEAQTLACPIIVSDIISNRQQVTNEVDGLVAELTPRAIADAIRDLAEHPDKARRLGERASMRKIAYEEDMELLKSLI